MSFVVAVVVVLALVVAVVVALVVVATVVVGFFQLRIKSSSLRSRN